MAATIFRRLIGHPHEAAALLQACGSGAPARPFQLVQLAAFSASAAASSGKLFGVCLLERLPVVIPEDPEWQQEHYAWQQSMQQKYMKILPKEFIELKDSELLADDAGARYEPAPRITEADKANDRRSLKRRLDQRLFMLVRPKASSSVGTWSFMQQENQEGETMRQTAESALAEAVDTSAVQPYFVGNAPAGHVQLGEQGTLFFHRCQLIQGIPALQGSSGYSDFVWVAKDEFGEYIQQPDVLSLLQKML